MGEYSTEPRRDGHLHAPTSRLGQSTGNKGWSMRVLSDFFDEHDPVAYSDLGAAALGAAVAAYVLWWRKNPSACPYALRFFVELPHPFITRGRLRGSLAPSSGEGMLEVGPGTGYYTLPVAEWLSWGTLRGYLDILDLQQEMLDHVVRRGREHGIENIVPTRGDATALPYPDDAFDAAYLTVVLGETPDQDAALHKLRRVLKPGGRLFVVEILVDPQYVAFGSLRGRAEAAGLRFEERLGGRLGYFVRFRA